MRVLLVNMPWALIDIPSLSLGILRQAVIQTVPDAEVEVVPANLDYVDWVTGKHAFGVNDYDYYSLASYFYGVGDWVFSSALYDDPQWRVQELLDAAPMSATQQQLSLDLHADAPEFVAETAARILAHEPDLVGFTSTFQQNIPALAVIRAIKRAAPGVLTAMGGANCDGEQGVALHRNFDFVDFVIRGEGETSFPQLLLALQNQASLTDIAGLCWRGSDGSRQVNPMSRQPLTPAQIIAPNYDGYFERLDSSAARNWVEPKLVVEGARGCWWGEKHHCKFCGLNGSFMQFRSKSPESFWQEILHLVKRHQILDMYVVDNILDMSYVKSLLPMIIESGYDLRMHYEIKSNMRTTQLQTLAEAGLVQVQPGIENLHSRVLSLMDKGVTGCQNVRMLRDAVTAGLSIEWNYLYGFPGETAQDYLPVIEQMPALHHLPPVGGISRIAIERFSPFFNRPELGFSELRPHRQYLINYDLPEAELMDLAYVFSVPDQGIDEQVADLLLAAATRWQQEYATSRLSHTVLGEEILLVSRRAGFDWTTHRLTDPAQVATFRLLDLPHTLPALSRKLAEAGYELPVPTLDRLMADWVALGVVFTESGHYVHVAPESRNQHLMRIDMTKTLEQADLAGVSS